MKARIGTRIGELIEQCGGFVEEPARIITGSPLSGKEVTYLDEPVGKTCYAIVAMAKSQMPSGEEKNCINCGECRIVCPVGLDPQYMYKWIKSNGMNNSDGDLVSFRDICHGCGCCKIVCPSALLLTDMISGKIQETVLASRGGVRA
jgi:electron transport complex protein RnfC